MALPNELVGQGLERDLGAAPLEVSAREDEGDPVASEGHGRQPTVVLAPFGAMRTSGHNGGSVKPNFLIVGAMKAGTTWLAHMLRQHPSVYIAPEEIHYFTDPRKLARGVEWYEAQFRPRPGTPAVGEKSVDYMLHPSAMDRIVETIPGVRTVAVLRDPVDRALSQISHHVRYGNLKADDMAMRSRGPDAFLGQLDRRFAVVERGRYASQIDALRDRFGVDRVRVVINEIDIRNDPDATLRSMCEFLEVDATFAFTGAGERVHEERSTAFGLAVTRRFPRLGTTMTRVDRFLPGAPRRPFVATAEERAALRERYRPELERLADVLGRPLPASWCAPSP